MDINYNLETLTGKHGGLLEVVEAIISDGRLILILTDEDVLSAATHRLKASSIG
jgi:glycerol dehydrogenase-like iron-containing ADH family enzyme